MTESRLLSDTTDFESKKAQSQLSVPVYVARQPVFDRQESIWGYELLYRANVKDSTWEESANVATSKVISDGIFLALSSIPDSNKVLINFPKYMLLNGSAKALSPEVCIPEILEDVEATPKVIAAVKELKELGYTIAVDDFTGQKELEPYFEIADILKVDMLGMSFAEIIKITQRLKPYKFKLLGEKIEDRKTYELAKSLGYDLFQGYFFAKPEIVEGSKIASNGLTKLKLLKEFADPEYQVKDLAKTISFDVGLSHRLLRYISTISRESKITSLAHAVTIMGGNPLKQWLMITMLADGSEGDRGKELIFQAARRGKFMELISGRIKNVRIHRESLFLLGLFSNLDALLNQPMHEVLKNLPLDDELSCALRGEENPLRGFVELLESIELGDWRKVDAVLEVLEVSQPAAAKAFAAAGLWAHEIISHSGEKSY